MATQTATINEITAEAGEVQAHQWRRQALLRALLLLCTIVSMALASGAGTKWMGW